MLRKNLPYIFILHLMNRECSEQNCRTTDPQILKTPNEIIVQFALHLLFNIILSTENEPAVILLETFWNNAVSVSTRIVIHNSGKH